MVEIIRLDPDPAVAKHITCPHCAVTLRYVPNDIFVEKYANDYLGGHETRNVIQCPNCHKVLGV